MSSAVSKCATYVFPGNNIAETDLCKDPFSSLFTIMLVGVSKSKGAKLSSIPGHFKAMFLHTSHSVMNVLPHQVFKISQSVQRTLNGDSRNDLAFLEYAISAVASLYPVTIEENKNVMLKFWAFAKTGMQSMALTYEELEEDPGKEVSFKRWERRIAEIISSATSSSPQKEVKKGIVEKVKKLWSLAEIGQFNEKLTEIEVKGDLESKAAFIKVFEEKLNEKALAFISIVTEELSLLDTNF